MRTPEESAIATVVIRLMQDVVYRDASAQSDTWEVLLRHRSAVQDHFAAIGVNLIVDESEGYAYLHTREPEDGEEPLPRLVRRRRLTYGQSLLLLLLRKRLLEFDSQGTEGKLVLTRDEILEMLRVFQETSSNEARVVDQADRIISQVTELGFLRTLSGSTGNWEVRRMLKAYVDAETISDFAGQLEAYAGQGSATDGEETP